jgi:transposase
MMRGELRQARAAELLGIGVRQVKRLVRSYRCEGEASVVSRRRGKPSNNRLDAAKAAAIEAALRTRYADFGATLASEKLGEVEGVSVSRETVRQIQIRLGLWRPKRRRAKKIFQVRERRPRFGELIQIDGSPHDWFEGRGPRCTLIVFIDDATGRLTRLQFAPAETTKAYLQALERRCSRTACRWPSIRIGTGFSASTPKRRKAAMASLSSAASSNGCASNSFTPRPRKPRAGWSAPTRPCRIG